jgi:hypothetical protein
MQEHFPFSPTPQAALGFADLAPLAERGSLEAALARFGLTGLPEAAGRLHLTAGTELALGQAPIGAWVRQTLHTNDIDVLKRWIGRADDEGMEQADLPSGEWTGPALARHELSPEQLVDVEKAAHIYLYGDSRLVRSYREVLESSFGTVEVDLWMGDKLVIETGASLLLRRPTALLVREVEIHEGGNLYLYNVASLALGTLRKIAAPQN